MKNFTFNKNNNIKKSYKYFIYELLIVLFLHLAKILMIL